jgi:hypothetical protein
MTGITNTKSYNITSIDKMSLKFFDAIHDTILMAVHQQNYKNGAFKNSIVATTPVISALNFLIASSHLSFSEKDIIKTFRKKYSDIANKFPDDEPAVKGDSFIVATLEVYPSLDAMATIFTNDARDRGVYIPPICIQTLNEDGSVKETRT